MKRVLLMLSTAAVAATFATSAGAGGQGAGRGSFPYDEVVFVPCANGGTGEYVELSGSINFVFRDTFDAAGGMHVEVHTNLQGVSGVGMTTGTKYRGSGGDADVFYATPDDAPFVSSTLTSVRVVGQGTGNNFTLHESAHFTVNANGDVTAQHEHFSVDCK